MRPTTTPPEQQPQWKRGTDLRDDSTGLYRWPHPHFVAEDPSLEQLVYPSVTTFLDEFLGTGMRHAEAWFTAEYVKHLAEQARDKAEVDVWLMTDNVDGGEVVQVLARDLLMNTCPEGFGKNFGMHWIKKAGPREMRRRANRGSIIHDALEEWAYGQKVDSDDVQDYCQGLLQARGFALPVEYVVEYVRQLLLWCERHVADVLMAEAVVMNDTYLYAGTLDTVLKLRGYPDLGDEVGIVDAKGSKGDQPSHELQASGYFFSEYVGVPNTAERLPMVKCAWAANLYVQPEKVTLRRWPRIQQCDNPQDCIPFRALLFARQLWQEMFSDMHPVTCKPVTVKLGDVKMPQALADQIAQGSLTV